MIPLTRDFLYTMHQRNYFHSLSLFFHFLCTALYRYYFCISNRIFLSFFLSYSIWGTHMILHLFILQLEASPFRGRYPKLVGGTNSDRFQPSSIIIIIIFGNSSDRLHHPSTQLHKINQRPEPYSFKWYSNTLPRVFPMATYSLLAEKSTAVTCPKGVLEVGQLSKEVRLGR